MAGHKLNSTVNNLSLRLMYFRINFNKLFQEGKGELRILMLVSPFTDNKKFHCCAFLKASFITQNINFMLRKHAVMGHLCIIGDVGFFEAKDVPSP